MILFFLNRVKTIKSFAQNYLQITFYETTSFHFLRTHFSNLKMRIFRELRTKLVHFTIFKLLTIISKQTEYGETSIHHFCRVCKKKRYTRENDKCASCKQICFKYNFSSFV